MQEAEGITIEESYRSESSKRDDQNYVEGEGMTSRRTTGDANFRDNSRLSASTSIGGGDSKSRSSRRGDRDQDSMNSTETRQQITRSRNEETYIERHSYKKEE